MELFLLTLPSLHCPPLYSAQPLPGAPPLRLPSQTEHIQSPQEVTMEGDKRPSAVVIVTIKGTTTATHIG